jgi:Tfp pilus assembly protein PilF
MGNRHLEACGLHWLASLSDTEGDAEAALRLCGDALALRRQMRQKARVAETLVSLGRTRLAQGDGDKALADLEEALPLARAVQQPVTILLATVYRARLSGGDVEAALAALEEHGQRVPHDNKVEARFRVWELTKDKTHLTEAKRLLDFAVEHTLEEYRTSMIENVPLHRDIMRAWEEHGTGSAS